MLSPTGCIGDTMLWIEIRKFEKCENLRKIREIRWRRPKSNFWVIKSLWTRSIQVEEYSYPRINVQLGLLHLIGNKDFKSNHTKECYNTLWVQVSEVMIYTVPMLRSGAKCDIHGHEIRKIR